MPDHSLLSALLIFGLGGLLGGVGGLFGIGGGLIAIPALGLLYGMDQQLAQGTSLVMIAPNVVIGFWQYRKRADIELRTAIVLGLSAVLATYFSARLATAMDAQLLRRIFAIFMIGLALYFLWRLMPGRAVTQQQARLSSRWIPAVGVVGGAFSGSSAWAAAWWRRRRWSACSACGRPPRRGWRWRWSRRAPWSR